MDWRILRHHVNENEIMRTMPLAFLAPDIVEDTLNGQQPENIISYRLKRLSPLPLDWSDEAETIQNLS